MAAHQPDLFAMAPLVPGLTLVEDVVDAAEEVELAARIDASGLAPFQFQGWQGKRLTASFGHSYDFERGKLDPAPPIPDWLEPLRTRAAAIARVEAAALRQALLIRYDPGAAIGWHRDRPQFGTVVGVSLGSLAVLRLRRRAGNGFERRKLALPPRSLYVLADEARHAWEHSIVAGEQLRYSITFRSLVVRGGDQWDSRRWAGRAMRPAAGRSGAGGASEWRRGAPLPRATGAHGRRLPPG